MATFNMPPSSTQITTGNWDLVGGGSFHANLADTDDGTGMRTDVQNEVADFQTVNFTASHTTIDSIRHFVRGFKFNTRGGTVEIQVAILDGSGTELYSENHDFEFNGYTPLDFYGTARTDIDGNPSHVWDVSTLNGLRLVINTSPEDPDGPSYAQFIRAHIEVTYDTVVAEVEDNATFFGANF